MAPAGLVHSAPHAPQLDAVDDRSVSQPSLARPSQSPHPPSQVNPQRPDAQLADAACAGAVQALVVYARPSALQTLRSAVEAQLGSPGVHTHAVQRPEVAAQRSTGFLGGSCSSGMPGRARRRHR